MPTITKKSIRKREKQQRFLQFINSKRFKSSFDFFLSPSETEAIFHRNGPIKANTVANSTWKIGDTNFGNIQDLFLWLSNTHQLKLFDNKFLAKLFEFTARAMRRLFLASPEISKRFEKAGPGYYEIKNQLKGDEKAIACTFISILKSDDANVTILRGKKSTGMALYRSNLTDGPKFIGVIAHQICHEFQNYFWPTELEEHGPHFINLLTEVYARLQNLGLNFTESWD